MGPGVERTNFQCLDLIINWLVYNPIPFKTPNLRVDGKSDIPMKDQYLTLSPPYYNLQMLPGGQELS